MVFEPNGGARKPISSSAVDSAIGMRHGGQLRNQICRGQAQPTVILYRESFAASPSNTGSQRPPWPFFLLISLQYEFKQSQLRRCN